MATKRTFYFGTLLIVMSLFSIYVSMGDDVRMRVDNDKSVFYVNESNRWLISGIEEFKMVNGTKTVPRIRSGIKRTEIFDIVTNTTTIYRTTPYKGGCIVNTSWAFDGKNTELDKFPVIHPIERFNCTGLRLEVDWKRLVYDGETIKGVTSPQSFGRNMKVEWDGDYYYSKIYKYKWRDEGKLTVKWRTITDYEVINVRLFDPPKDELIVLENTDECLIDCYTIYEYTPSKKHNSDFNVEYYDKKMKKLDKLKIEKSIIILENITKQQPIKEFKNTIVKINQYIFNNKTGENEIIEETKIKKEEQIIGYEDYYELVENAENIKNKLFKKDEKIIFKVSGNKKPFDDVDNIVTLGGKMWTKYAWWNGSWDYKKEATITTDYNYTHHPANFSINLSAEHSANKVNQTCKDIRFANSTETGELYYDIVICNLSVSDIATFSIHLDSITTENKTIYMYYGNNNANTTEDYYNTYNKHDNNMVLNLPMKLGSGSTAWDVSGQGNNGTITNATWISGGGLDFDGNGDFINLGNDSSLDLTSENFSLIFLADVDAFQQDDQFYAKSDYNVAGFLFHFKNNSGGLGLLSSQSGAHQSYYSTTYMSIDTLTQITAIRTGENISFFLNETELGSVRVQAILDPASTASDSYIARRENAGSPEYLDAQIYSVKIYNTSLTPTQISLYYNETKYPPTFSFGTEEDVYNMTLYLNNQNNSRIYELGSISEINVSTQYIRAITLYIEDKLITSDITKNIIYNWTTETFNYSIITFLSDSNYSSSYNTHDDKNYRLFEISTNGSITDISVNEYTLYGDISGSTGTINKSYIDDTTINFATPGIETTYMDVTINSTSCNANFTINGTTASSTQTYFGNGETTYNVSFGVGGGNETIYINVPRYSTLVSLNATLTGTNSSNYETVSLTDNAWVSSFNTRGLGIQAYYGTGFEVRDSYLQSSHTDYNSVKEGQLYLYIYSKYNQYPTGYNFYVSEVADDSWDENTITYSTKPATGSNLFSSEIADLSLGYLVIDIATYLKVATIQSYATLHHAYRSSVYIYSRTDGTYPAYIRVYHYPSTFKIDTGNDGVYDYEVSVLNVTDEEIELNYTAMQEYIDNQCTTDMCSVPLLLLSATDGQPQFKNLEVVYSMTPYNVRIDVDGETAFTSSGVLNYTSFMVYDIDTSSSRVSVEIHNDRTGNVTIESLNQTYTVGEINTTDLDWFNITAGNWNNNEVTAKITSYYDGTANMTIKVNNSAYSAEHEADVRYSRYSKELPDVWLDYPVFFPNNNESQNVTPYRQTSSIPIYNITSESTHEYTYDFYMSVTDKPSCVDLWMSNTSSKNDAIALNSTNQSILTNCQYPDTHCGGIHIWADYNCNRSDMTYYFDFAYYTKCTECI